MNNTLTARVRLQDGISKSLGKIQNRLDKINSYVTTIESNVTKLGRGMTRLKTTSSEAGNSMQRSFKQSNRDAMELSQTVNKLLHLYLAVSGAQSMIATSDVMTGAQNKLNYINAQSLGENGTVTNPDGTTSYSQATLNATQEDLSKMYSSSQKVRANYADMIGNVSKSMTLAPDAFSGNIDNAIRFQEIMAEAYTLGGASAQEMSSSMYQMIQALGSGILQGDELRSVREGAPIAYKEIEKFAQGVYNTEKSLKDLASQGLITSDLVVAAMMKAGDSIDSAFAMTDMTYAQAWVMIKNAAIQAFRPVFTLLNEFLNSDKGRAAIELVISLTKDLVNAVYSVAWIVTGIIGFLAQHQGLVKTIVYGAILGIGLIVTALGFLKLKALATWVAMALPLAPFILLISIVVAGVLYGATVIFNAASSTAEGIVNAMWYVAYAILIAVALITAGIALGLVTVTAGVYAVVLFIIACILILIGLFIKYADIIIGVIYGVGAVFKAIWQNIGIGWNNMLIGMETKLWTFIQSAIEKFKPLLEVVNSMLEAMGEKTINLDIATNKLNTIGKKSEYVDIGDAYSSGYKKGSIVGQNFQNWVNGLGTKLDDLKNGVELDTSATGINGLGNKLDDISSDTSDISDAVALTNEDLEYLRKIAAMEWKKEYTTANIVVDMTNNNTINSDNDLDGIVTKLSDKLRQELGEVANGVYV